MTSDRLEIEDALREEAAAWLLERNGSHCRDGEFERWLMASPQHMDAWADVQSMWQMLGTLGPEYQRLTASPVAGIPLSKREPKRRHARRKTAFRISAGSAFVAMLGLVTFAVLPDAVIRWQADYRTTIAQSRSVVLEDGSIVQLAADSALKVEFSAGRRDVTLLKGEAFFTVTRNAERPFIVNAQGVGITVLGTEFDVKLDNFSTQVSLASGAVKASLGDGDEARMQSLVPGERLTVERQTGSMRVDSIATDDIGTWRNGRLFVIDASVGAVVENIQRYHTAWIAIPDRDLAQTRVTGIYDLSDPDQALAALVSPFGGKVRHVTGFGRIISRY